MRPANFTIVRNTPEELTIRDIGPWDHYPTVTNAAEDTVKYLVGKGYLKPGQRLYYYDSENQLDEIVVENGRFKDFRVIDRRTSNGD